MYSEVDTHESYRNPTKSKIVLHKQLFIKAFMQFTANRRSYRKIYRNCGQPHTAMGPYVNMAPDSGYFFSSVMKTK